MYNWNWIVSTIAFLLNWGLFALLEVQLYFPLEFPADTYSYPTHTQAQTHTCSLAFFGYAYEHTRMIHVCTGKYMRAHERTHIHNNAHGHGRIQTCITWMHAYSCTHVQLRTHARALTHTHSPIHTYTHSTELSNVRTYTCTHANTRVYKRIHAHKHTRTFVHVRTFAQFSLARTVTRTLKCTLVRTLERRYSRAHAYLPVPRECPHTHKGKCTHERVPRLGMFSLSHAVRRKA